MASLLMREGKASGVVLADGAKLPPRRLRPTWPEAALRQAGAREAVAPEIGDRLRRIKTGSGTFRMNVALAELPDFTARPGTTVQPHHGSASSSDPPWRTWTKPISMRECNAGLALPVVEMLISSTLDDGLAPPGKHVASLFVQHVAPKLPAGRAWDDHKQAFAEIVIDTVSRHAPNFRDSILGRQVLSPLDLERRFGLIDGDIFHGQLGWISCSAPAPYSATPIIGCPSQGCTYAAPAPIRAAASPDPGRNAAREILRDL